MIVAGKLKVVVMEPRGWLQIAPRDRNLPAPRQRTAAWGSRERLGACGNAGGWEHRVQCRTRSAETLHFVHSSVLGGHFSNLFPVRLLDPQNAHLGLEKKHPLRLPYPFVRAVSMPNTCIFVFQTGDPSSSFKPR